MKSDRMKDFRILILSKLIVSMDALEHIQRYLLTSSHLQVVTTWAVPVSKEPGKETATNVHGKATCTQNAENLVNFAEEGQDQVENQSLYHHGANRQQNPPQKKLVVVATVAIELLIVKGLVNTGALTAIQHGKITWKKAARNIVTYAKEK